jgi:hydrogenase nickel incorporation protein HypA/HybF
VHESSLARRILEAVLARARDAGVERVRVVRGHLAETEALSLESLQLHFEALSQGTPAEGARLELWLVHVEARCHGCGQSYAPEHHLLLCPRCGSTDGTLLGRTGLWIESLEAE